MANLIPFDERTATRAAAQAAIDATLSTDTAKAEKLLTDARTAASRGTAALQVAALKADAEARDHVAKAFRLQCTSLISELLSNDSNNNARAAMAKYRSLQREAVVYCNRELPLMPLMVVGQVLITRAPEAKSRIARLGTIGGDYGHCAGIEIAAAHEALMGSDPRAVRDTVANLERKLLWVARVAVPAGDSDSDAVWEAVKRGLGLYEIDDLLRGLAKAARQASIGATNEHQAYVRAVRRGEADAIAKASQTPGLIEAFRRLSASMFGEVTA